MSNGTLGIINDYVKIHQLYLFLTQIDNEAWDEYFGMINKPVLETVDVTFQDNKSLMVPRHNRWHSQDIDIVDETKSLSESFFELLGSSCFQSVSSNIFQK